LNVKPSETKKHQLLLDCLIDATPERHLDLSQARRRRKKQSNGIDDDWRDSYAVTNEDDEEEDDDEDDDEDGDDVDMKEKEKETRYGTPLKIHHPSYILGSKMAAAREVHSHRKMCDETLRRFIAVKKFDLALFSEAYLEHIAEKSTTKVKKNGLTYLNNMAKHLLKAQYLMYKECKRGGSSSGDEHVVQWKLEVMHTHNVIAQAFIPLTQHFGFVLVAVQFLAPGDV